ncbi:uncharacterized protein LOC135155309 [Lytechinus pictus]|uniref:uncharacterized protein LOC135155309 n=1 Tax=Lytechinus pictus TaxID=7653 RepID=UPI0030B9DDB9
MVFNGEQVGAQKVGVAPKGGECGIVRLVRTVCKSIQDRGCEKSGKPVHFRTQFLTGCRVLGLVNKFVTAPLWRVLEGKERITTMDERYKIMSKFEEWAVDSSPLLDGTAVLFHDIPVQRDEIYESLLTGADAVTKQVLPLS